MTLLYFSFRYHNTYLNIKTKIHITSHQLTETNPQNHCNPIDIYPHVALSSRTLAIDVYPVRHVPQSPPTSTFTNHSSPSTIHSIRSLTSLTLTETDTPATAQFAPNFP